MASMQDNSAKAQLTNLIKPIAGDGHDINEQAFKAKHAVAHLLGKVQKALRKEPRRQMPQAPEASEAPERPKSSVECNFS